MTAIHIVLLNGKIKKITENFLCFEYSLFSKMIQYLFRAQDIHEIQRNKLLLRNDKLLKTEIVMEQWLFS